MTHRKVIDDPRAFGKRLRAAREKARLSQRQLAFPGCTNAYISRIESGERSPSRHLIEELARRLDVSSRWLTTGVEEIADRAAVLDADVALRLGEVEEARDLYLNRLAHDPDDALGLAGLGELALRQNQISSAIALLEQALAARHGQLLKAPTVVESLVRAYVQQGALDSAIVLLERALEEAEQARAPVEILRFLILLANALIDTGDRKRADLTLAKAIRAAEELRDPIGMARVLWSQSRLHVMHKDPAVAVRYARRAIDILERTEHDSYVAMAYHALAYAEIEAGRPELALGALEHGRSLLRGDLSAQADAQFALEETRALLALGRVSEAADAAGRALEKLDALDPGDRGRGYFLLGRVFDASGAHERALGLLELAVETLEQAGKPFVGAAARKLAELLEEAGQRDQALVVLRRAVDGNGPSTRGP